MRYANRPGRVNYEPNSLGGNARSCLNEGRLCLLSGADGRRQRACAVRVSVIISTGADHGSQIRQIRKQHITQALQFELGKPWSKRCNSAWLICWANVDGDLATNVGAYLGLTPKAGQANANAGKAKGLSQLEYVPAFPPAVRWPFSLPTVSTAA